MPARIETDAELRITLWDDEAASLYGWSAREAIGQPIWIIVPRQRQPFVARMWPRVREGATLGPYLGVHVRRDGARIGVEIAIEPVRSASGEVVGARGLVTASERARDEPIE